MKRILLLLVLTISLLVAACGKDATPAATPAATEPPTITATPDLCSSENLPAQAARIHNLMREFDDYSSLASNTPQAQLVVLIPEMQRILRNAEDQAVPACLQGLKKLQAAHMTVVVQTLMAFMSNSDINLVDTGILQSRELHTQYDIELARLLGLTLTIPPSPISDLATPDTNAALISPTIAPVVTVTNPGPSGVNLRNAPDLNAPEVGILAVQSTTIALGKTEDDVWILVEIPELPGQTAWLYSTLVQLSVPIDQLTLVTP
ncbi:MAG: SH3 domain-containing protein [Anaerolineales bacterium]|nr:SH3 domain-containing protein [Anaerolineales bacterium]